MVGVYQTAQKIITQIGADATLADSFAKIIIFLVQNPDRAGYLNNRLPDSESYIENMARRFINSRQPTRPSMPSTVPDTMVELLLAESYEVPRHKIPEAIDMHMKAMGAENIIGYLLEYYIASVLEPRGWVWCSAPFVKAIDFIKPSSQFISWELLQVKNRDNSENSSSSAIRNGTQIQKWFRSFSQSGQTNWEKFPDAQHRKYLSEQLFHQFVRNFLAQF